MTDTGSNLSNIICEQSFEHPTTRTITEIQTIGLQKQGTLAETTELIHQLIISTKKIEIHLTDQCNAEKIEIHLTDRCLMTVG